MSDIYLQITETPTVVTLSAPVVSGALASTVTVANTVTVALDSNSLSALENVTVTVGAAITGTVTVSNFPASQAVTFSAVTISNFPATQTIAGTVTANLANVVTTDSFWGTQAIKVTGGNGLGIDIVGIDSNSTPTIIQEGGGIPVYPRDNSGLNAPFPISGTVTIGSALPAGTNRIGVVTIGAGTVTIGAGTAQIGSVTASIGLNSVGPSVIADSGFSLSTRGMMVVGGISTSDVGSSNEYRELKITSSGEALVRGTVTIGSLPALVAGTAQIGSVTASISNSVTIASLPAISGTVTANTFALQGTAVTTSNFTSTTASTVLAGFNATREVLTIFNEGAGLLFVCPGALCTTTAYQVRLSAGDYYEVPNHQTTITHSAVFATAGTARVTEVT